MQGPRPCLNSPSTLPPSARHGGSIAVGPRTSLDSASSQGISGREARRLKVYRPRLHAGMPVPVRRPSSSIPYRTIPYGGFCPGATSRAVVGGDARAVGRVARAAPPHRPVRDPPSPSMTLLRCVALRCDATAIADDSTSPRRQLQVSLEAHVPLPCAGARAQTTQVASPAADRSQPGWSSPI
jgi:hypothetical protein